MSHDGLMRVELDLEGLPEDALRDLITKAHGILQKKIFKRMEQSAQAAAEGAAAGSSTDPAPKAATPDPAPKGGCPNSHCASCAKKQAGGHKAGSRAATQEAAAAQLPPSIQESRGTKTHAKAQACPGKAQARPGNAEAWSRRATTTAAAPGRECAAAASSTCRGKPKQEGVLCNG